MLGESEQSLHTSFVTVKKKTVNYFTVYHVSICNRLAKCTIWDVKLSTVGKIVQAKANTI